MNVAMLSDKCIQLVLCLGIFSISGLLAHKFESPPTTVKTIENDTVLLPCYHNSPFKYVRWTRDGLDLADTRFPENNQSEKVTLYKNGSLEISSVAAEDTGYYTCEIMTTGGLASQTHAIEVTYAPVITMVPRNKVDVPVGSILEVLCNAEGTPRPLITWNISFENEASFKGPNKLMIPIKGKNMSGIIECQATNGVGDAAVEQLDVAVSFTPEVEAKHKIVHTKNNLNTQLECITMANPPASVHWFHNHNPIFYEFRISRQDIEVMSNVTDRHQAMIRHILNIRNVRDTDFGSYECKAENKIGMSGAHIELTGRPKTPVFKFQPEMTTPTKHKMIWSTESFAPIVEYKLRFRKIPSGNVTPSRRFPDIQWLDLIVPSDGSEDMLHSKSYTMNGLEPTTVYEVLVIARNRYGWSKESNIVRFATGGEVEVDQPTTEIIQKEDTQEEQYSTDIVSASFIPLSSSKSLANVHQSLSKALTFLLGFLLSAFLV